MAYELTETPEGMLVYTIKRREKRNAINYEVMEGLKNAIEVAKNSSHRAFVVTGDGEEAFCSGGDLSVFHTLRTEEEAHGMLSKMAQILYDLYMLDKPTIALINGAATGGGCELAAACDFRFAHDRARAGFVQGGLAITTGWGGGTMLLEKLSITNGLQMLLKAKIYNSVQLKDLGFVDYIYHNMGMEGLIEGLETITSIETDVLKAYKMLLIHKREHANIWPQIEKEVRNCAKLWEKDAHHQKVEAFFRAKRDK